MPTLQQQGLVEERPRPARRPAHGADRLRALVQSWLDEADVKLDGDRPWDFQIKHPKVLERVLAEGSLGLGEAYMDGWWECERLDELFARVLRARVPAVLLPPPRIRPRAVRRSSRSRSCG